MKINKIKKSRLETVDFNNLPFGSIFSDHMLICEFKNGKWNEPEIKPYGPLKLSPGTQALHYGQSIFEGMKAFKSKKDNVLLFRPDKNFERINNSAKRLSIPQIPKDVFIDGLKELLRIDSCWVSKREGYSLYIRPFVFGSSECIKANSSNDFTFVIITSPTMNYYSDPIDILIEQKFTRAMKGGVGFTKASGNYAASFYPTSLAEEKGYTQLLWTDGINHENIEESGTMNIWFRIKDKLVTPKLTDSILPGVTRNSILTLASEMNLKVEERTISITEIINSFKNKTLLEAFGSGTAVVLSKIRSISYNEEKYYLPNQEDSYCDKIKTKLVSIQRGDIEDTNNWTVSV